VLEGVKIIRRALEEPLRQIAINAGHEGSVVVEKIRAEADNLNFGFNAEKGTYEDLMSAGVIDPAKVTRFALQHAASVSSLLLTTECMVAEKKEDKPAGGPPMGGGGGMGGMGGMYGYLPPASLRGGGAPAFSGAAFKGAGAIRPPFLRPGPGRRPWPGQPPLSVQEFFHIYL
jgi:hypothetical protein